MRIECDARVGSSEQQTRRRGAHDITPSGSDRALRDLRRDLHDRVGSTLSGIKIQLELAMRLIEQRPDEVARVIRELYDEAAGLVTYIRGIAAGRDPDEAMAQGPAESGGWATRLRAMLVRMRRAFGERLELDFHLDEGLEHVPADVGSAAFWIIHEAIINVLKHSRAEHCWISVALVEDEVRVVVRDDGVGLVGGGVGCGNGTINMIQRAWERGGWCTIGPTESQGMQVSAGLPVRLYGEEPDYGHRAQNEAGCG
ncbi:sensor histidine kinase [Plantactinospora sp. KBS50]|uniref:sensor histidine kinase n=1 Tax=Plantactinospora sp. KBS50 TaxID=2024580 RepID=UPI0012FE235A|nr:histidine kinase [Plantactinospora sp. KBS50]